MGKNVNFLLLCFFLCKNSGRVGLVGLKKLMFPFGVGGG